MFLEPGTHHCAHPIRLAVCDENHNVKFVRDWPMIQAWWLQRLGRQPHPQPRVQAVHAGRRSLFQDVRHIGLIGTAVPPVPPSPAETMSRIIDMDVIGGRRERRSISSGTNAAFLLLCALGLIVILGMMNIINLAHGELMMLGAYTATSASYQPWRAVLRSRSIIAFFAVGTFGAVLERRSSGASTAASSAPSWSPGASA